MNGDDGLQRHDAQHDATNDATSEAPDDVTVAADDEREFALTFSYDPNGSLEELFGVGEETLFDAFERALARVGVMESVEVSVLITSDEGIRTLNREYRGKDEATDVLSFPLLDQPLVDAPADQLWPAITAEDETPDDAQDQADDDDFADDFADGADGQEQNLKGMIVLVGDDDDEFDDDPENWPTHLGDIAISRETTLRQAQQAGHSAAYEVAYLFVHGVLHLVGFDDHTDAGYQAMVAHQEAVLAQAGVAR